MDYIVQLPALPDWAIEQAQKEAEARETEALIAPLFEPVPEPLILPPLTPEIVKYFERIFIGCKRLGHSMTPKLLLKIVTRHNEFTRRGRSWMSGDAEHVVRVLEHCLPPCEILKEHMSAFVRLLVQRKQALQQRQFRAEVLEVLLDIGEPWEWIAGLVGARE